MSTKKKPAAAKRKNPAGRLALLAVLVLIFCICNLMVFVETYKFLTLLALAAMVVVLALGRFGGQLKQRLSLPVPFLAAYVLLCGLSVLWAQSGKFFLKEYARLLLALAAYLAIVLCLPRTRSAVRTLAGCFVGAAAVYAAASVDLASLGLFQWLWNSIGNYAGMQNGFESGTRLTGIFGNGNILAGVLSIGLLLSIYGMEDAETDGSRRAFAVGGSICAYGFLLAFSMGASGFFVLAVLVYLALAGKSRGSVLLRMLQLAVPTVVFVFAAFSFFEATGAARALPWLAMLLNAAAVWALEAFVYPKLAAKLAGREKLAGVLVLAVLVLAAGYGAAGLMVHGGAVLQPGETMNRAVYPAAGENALLADCSENMNVTVTSQDAREVMMHTSTRLYRGPASEAVFTVPEGSRVVYLNFWVYSKDENEGFVDSAALETGETVALKYPLLPGFIANRLQGLLANENAIQRTVFFADGMELFREKPLLGQALGSFESASWGVQEFDYETKYVHDHYIQVLMDNGVVGLTLFAGFALATVWLLVKSRKREDEFRAFWPAAGALVVMILGHGVMEVTLSAACYLPFAYGAFAMIALCFGQPLTEKKAPAQAVRFGMLGLTAVYAVLLILNMSCKAAMNTSRRSAEEFYSALKTDISLDVFERNDALLSYVINAPDLPDEGVKEKARDYAEKLCDVRSNAIQNYLVAYYLKTGDIAGASYAGQRGAEYNRASQDVWNALFNTYYNFILGSEAGKYDFDEAGALLNVEELYGLMEYYNEEVLWQPIQLDETAQEIVDLALQ